MQFKKFSSLENTYKQKSVDRVKNSDLGSSEFFVTEKVHGANFCFYCDGVDIKVASRNQFVDGSFYNCQEVVDLNKEKIFALQKPIGSDIQVFGELCGQGIRKEINYGEKKFLAFDLVIDVSAINKKEAFSLFKEFNIDTVPFIGLMSLDEALSLEVEFESNAGTGVTEGIVIEPVNPSFIGESRVYFKKKSKAFSEKKNESKEKIKAVISDKDKDKLSDLLQYVNSSRLSNVISKIGLVEWKDFGKLTGLLSQDAMNESEIEKQDFDDWNSVKKYLSKECADIVREYLKSMEE